MNFILCTTVNASLGYQCVVNIYNIFFLHFDCGCYIINHFLFLLILAFLAYKKAFFPELPCGNVIIRSYTMYTVEIVPIQKKIFDIMPESVKRTILLDKIEFLVLLDGNARKISNIHLALGNSSLPLPCNRMMTWILTKITNSVRHNLLLTVSFTSLSKITHLVPQNMFYIF